MDKVVLHSGVSTEKAERPPPPLSLPPLSSSPSTTATNSDQQKTNPVPPVRLVQNPALLATETASRGPANPCADVVGWPKIYFSLSKEEKEDEFVALKNSPVKASPESSKKKAKTNNLPHHQEQIVANGNMNNNSQIDMDNGSDKHHRICSSPGGVDGLLQWGQKKRSRGSRAENGWAHARGMFKAQGRVAGGPETRPSGHHCPEAPAGNTRGFSLWQSTAPVEATTSNNGHCTSRSMDKRMPDSPEKAMKPPASGPLWPILANNNLHTESNGLASAVERSSMSTAGPMKKVNMELFEWPKIYISLSRKEKEDGFLAIKGTKLPQRPKKRPKIVDRNLQYCFPGMWLCDMSRGRYEVREKKCVKKTRRGLKGLESMDSDSE